MQLNEDGLITLSKSASLKPYQARTFPTREYLTDQDLLDNVGKTLFLNVESYPNFFLISFKLHGINKFLQLETPFNPRLLSWIMNNYLTVGFNSLNYDLLMIWLAYSNQDTYRIKDATNDLILRGMREYELKKEYNFFTFKTNHIDLIQVAPLKGSLKLYGARIHTKSIQDQPFDVDKDLSPFEIDQLKGFNCNQLDITEELFNFCKERIELREAMGAEYHEDLRSKSDAQIAEVVLTKEVAKINGEKPKKITIEPGTTYRYSVPSYLAFQSKNLQNMLNQIKIAKFIVNGFGKIDLPDELKTSVQIGKGEYKLGIGGLHSSEKTIAYKSTNDISIVDKDVQSYYPRIVTNLKLYPHSMGPAFLEAYENIIKARLEAKKNKQLTKDKGLKITINGAGGKFSDFWSTLYAPDLTIQMTVTGQLALLMLIELLELSGIEVISANTDGIVMLVEKCKEADLKYCIDFWENKTNFITEETRYSAYYARDCNSYIAMVKE